MAAYDGDLAESLSSDDGLAVTTETTVLESLSLDDSILPKWNAQCLNEESLSVADSILPKWNAQCLNEESLSVESLIDIIHSNVYGRYKNSLNYNGNTLQLKIQNNTAGEPFFLQDLGMLLYANEVQRQSTYSMNLKSQNIRLKIQNNTAGETLHLLDVGVRIYSNEAR